MDATIIGGGGALLLLLLIAAGAVLLYNYSYRKHVNRALEEDGAPGPAPEPSKAWKVILFLLLAVCFGLWEIHKMERIDELGSSLHGRIANLEQQVLTLEKNMEENMEERERLFSSFDWEVQDVDFPARSATVSFQAVPKEAAEDAAVSLQICDQVYDLTRGKNGVYSASVTLDPFSVMTSDGVSAFLTLTQNGRNQNEAADFYEDFREYFPKVEVPINLTLEENKAQAEVIVDVDATVSWADANQIRSLRLLVEQNGSVLDEVDLTQAMRVRGGSATLHGAYPTMGEIHLILCWEDSYGLIHKDERWSISVLDVPEWVEVAGTQSIYDAAGNLLGEIWDE